MDNKYIVRTDIGDDYTVRAVHVTEGLKVFMPNKKSCLELEAKLNELGIKTRAGRNCDVDLWSIYISSIPDDLVGACRAVPLGLRSVH